jgi:hypothetical protein
MPETIPIACCQPEAARPETVETRGLHAVLRRLCQRMGQDLVSERMQMLIRLRGDYG